MREKILTCRRWISGYHGRTRLSKSNQALTGAGEVSVGKRIRGGPPRDIPWNQGPDEAITPLDERPPNIILIVADDLGYNDISTFGGGLADGRVKTPHIDQLAADGVVFAQSYSGAGTCAPSRAMLMTGRYPTRTGFEFTQRPLVWHR